MLIYNNSTPILLILSNNSDTSKRILEKIKKASPKKLYISSDFWESEKDE